MLLIDESKKIMCEYNMILFDNKFIKNIKNDVNVVDHDPLGIFIETQNANS